jgi:hypothetical protein
MQPRHRLTTRRRTTFSNKQGPPSLSVSTRLRASLSAICQHQSLASQCLAPRRLGCPCRLSCGDVVWSMGWKSCVWGPHSLHTAEVTGSIPVTPTRQDTSPGPAPGAACQKICQKTTGGGLLPLEALAVWNLMRVGQVDRGELGRRGGCCPSSRSAREVKSCRQPGIPTARPSADCAKRLASAVQCPTAEALI